MKTSFAKTAIWSLASLGLATLLTFTACGKDGDSGGDDQSSSSGGGEDNSSSSNVGTPSSSSEEQSSSSAEASSSSAEESSFEDANGTFIDTRNSKRYKWARIGEQIWMAENLNYNASGSMCYGDDASNCITYGRLYDWSAAMDFDSDCNTSACVEQINAKHQGVCPAGWHLPSRAEWTQLFRYVDGDNGTSEYYNTLTAGGYLKAASGWNDYNGVSGNGTDAHGFSALPGGANSKFGGEGSLGKNGFWWTASEYQTNANSAYHAEMNYMRPAAYIYMTTIKVIWISVRCVRD